MYMLPVALDAVRQIPAIQIQSEFAPFMMGANLSLDVTLSYKGASPSRLRGYVLLYV